MIRELDPGIGGGGWKSLFLVLSAIGGAVLVGAISASAPAGTLLVAALIVLLLVGVKNPSVFLILLVISSVDWFQNNIVIFDLTPFQAISILLVLTWIVRFLIYKGRLTSMNPRMIMLFLALSVGLVVIPLFQSDVANVVLISTNLIRIILLVIIVTESRSTQYMPLLVLALDILSITVSVSILVAYLFPNLGIEKGLLFYEYGEYTRSMGLERDPNLAALKLLMLLPFSLSRLLEPELTRHKVALLAGQSLLIMAALLATGSRAGIATLIIVLLLWIVLNLRRRVAPWVFVFGVGAFVVRSMFSEILNRTLLSLGSGSVYYGVDITPRLDYARTGFETWLLSPIWGVGVARDGFHSAYVDLLSFYGLIGTIPLIAAILHIIKQHLFSKGYEVAGIASYLVHGIGLSLAAWMIMSVSVGSERELILWLIFGMGLAAKNLDMTRMRYRSSRSPST